MLLNITNKIHYREILQTGWKSSIEFAYILFEENRTVA